MKIFNNKKGQWAGLVASIGSGLSAITSGVTKFMDWFFKTMPKPLLLILFLFFLLLLGNLIIPLMANSFGYHCDTNGAVWKLPATSAFTNIDLIRKQPEYIDSNHEKIPAICRSGKVSGKVSACTNCTKNENYTNGFERGCVTDGYRINYSLFNTLTCEWIGCAPEENYFYNYTSDDFQCFDTSCINRTIDAFNAKLYNVKGATLAYQNLGNNRTAENMLYFKCKEDKPLNIRLTMFGIDIFDYRVWILLFVIGAIFWFYKLIK